MCQVQRVINSCGHINDHVLLTCRIGKPRSPSPEIETTNTSKPGCLTQNRRWSPQIATPIGSSYRLPCGGIPSSSQAELASTTPGTASQDLQKSRNGSGSEKLNKSPSSSGSGGGENDPTCSRQL